MVNFIKICSQCQFVTKNMDLVSTTTFVRSSENLNKRLTWKDSFVIHL